MKNKSFIKDLYILIPTILSGLLCIALVFLLWQKTLTTPDFQQTLQSLLSIFIALSGFLAAMIMIYLGISASGFKNARTSSIQSLTEFTQKMHTFRSIVELLLRSKMWLPGLKEYIDDEFEGLTFFEVKEFYKGKSKLAIEFLQERHNYAETENLYLELKSLLLTDPKQKKVSENIDFPQVYNKEIVAKWLEHKCGSGLWYFFGYKYGIFKDSLDLEAVYERHQDKIITLANSLDSDVFEDSSFNEVFLSRLGEYMTKQVIPKLYQPEGGSTSKMPILTRYMYGIFSVLVLLGVLLPLCYMLFGLPVITLIFSFSVTISCIFFITTTFYQFLSKEINS